MKLFNSHLLLISLFVFSSLSSLSSNPIITRHDIADSQYVLLADSYKEINSLIFFNKTDMAGTLIKNGWVLSAAHVAADLGIGDSLLMKTKKFRIDQIHIHPEWKNNQAYDLALIKINTGDDSLPTVPLYRGRDELHKIVVIAGNGAKGSGLSGPVGNDGQVRAATNRVEEVTDYWLKWNFYNPDTDSNKVTDMEGISGPGDSSGPAFIFIEGKGFLAGISSGQSTRATGGKEGVYGVREYYVRVSSYVDWITAMLSNN